MKPKKTAMTLALTALLAAFLAAPALAAENKKDIVYPPTPAPSSLPTSMSDFSTVKATAATAYTVTIPETIDFGKWKKDTTGPLEQTFTVTATDVFIPASNDPNIPNVLTVTVKGSGQGGAFTIKATSGSLAEMPYEVYNIQGTAETPVGVNGTFTDFAGGNPKDTQTVNGKVKLPGPPAYSGDYTGTLTFTCTVKPQS